MITQVEMNRILERVTYEGDCWLHAGALNCPNGYPQISFRGKRALVHKLLCEEAHGPSTLLALHKCDIKRCCNPEHLYCGTRRDNAVDVRERTWTSQQKLRREDIEIIKASTTTNRKTAASFGVSESMIGKIKKGYNWA